jgi:metallo-beta-lactamase class B
MARARDRIGWFIAAFGIIAALLIAWITAIHKNDAKAHGSDVTPFRIAGNFYYVGREDVSVFLVTSPQGHALIEGGYPYSPSFIVSSIRQLGFDIRDVKAILSSEAHIEHAGGLAELQRLSGASIYASDSTAKGIESGGEDIPGASFLPNKIFADVGLANYDPARVDHRVKDGDTVRVGPLAFVAHITSGHTIGCTTWTFTVKDGTRTLNVVDACALNLTDGMHLTKPEKYPGITEDFAKSFATLRSLPVDIWVTSHTQPWGRYRKYQASRSATHPADAFIDREGYAAYVDSAEARVRRKIADEGGR